jgi:hypothetical protein
VRLAVFEHSTTPPHLGGCVTGKPRDAREVVWARSAGSLPIGPRRIDRTILVVGRRSRTARSPGAMESTSRSTHALGRSRYRSVRLGPTARCSRAGQRRFPERARRPSTGRRQVRTFLEKRAAARASAIHSCDRIELRAIHLRSPAAIPSRPRVTAGHCTRAWVACPPPKEGFRAGIPTKAAQDRHRRPIAQDSLLACATTSPIAAARRGG